MTYRRHTALASIFGFTALLILAATAVHIIHCSPPRPNPIVTVATQKFFGYVPDSVFTKVYLASNQQLLLKNAGPTLYSTPIAADEPILLYRAIYKVKPNWTCSKQEIGDCVSHGWAHAADIHLATMYCEGDVGEWRAAATEAIYGGSRVEAQGKTFAGFEDGSFGAAAAKWVDNWGIVFRQRYELVDLSSYSPQLAKQWGAYGCGGKEDNGKMDTIAKQHPIKNVALVENFEEAAKAISSGYPIAVCSMQGFSMSRDANGFATPQGTWPHCMCFIGVRFDKPGLLCLNSWGTSWIDGPKYPEDQPDGSFWVDSRTATKMLSERDSFCVSGYQGFPVRELDHGAWVR